MAETKTKTGKRRQGSVVKLADRRFKIRWSETDESGKRKVRNKHVRGTRSDAERELRKRLAVRDTGRSYTEPTRETVAEYLESWLTTTKPGRAPRTQRDYDRALRGYVIPRLGGRKLARLEAPHIQALYSELHERGLSTRPGASGLGPRSIRLIHAPLRQALAQAVAWNKIAKSPADGVRLPKQRRTEKRALSPGEVGRLRTAAQRTPHEALWLFMLDTGARPSEALGLRWSDVDLDAASVTIRGAVARGEDGRAVLSEHPKTARSRRTLALHPQTVEALRAHRKRQAAHALQAGARFDRTLGLVFCDAGGGILHDSNLRRRHWLPLIEAAGLGRDVTPYSLRHTCATLALRANVPLLVVAERLGHSSPSMVLSVYGHVLEGQQAEATARLGAVLYGDES